MNFLIPKYFHVFLLLFTRHAQVCAWILEVVLSMPSVCVFVCQSVLALTLGIYENNATDINIDAVYEQL